VLWIFPYPLIDGQKIIRSPLIRLNKEVSRRGRDVFAASAAPGPGGRSTQGRERNTACYPYCSHGPGVFDVCVQVSQVMTACPQASCPVPGARF
jgi:hypothetical protein